MKKLQSGILLALVALLLIAVPVLAQSYTASIIVSETDSNDYAQLPIIATIDNAYLADSGYISTSGLDTRVLKASTELPHMLADDKTLFCSAVGADEQPVFTYTLGNEALDNFYTIVGHNGYVTIPDDATIIRPDGAGTYTEFEDVVGDTVHWEQVDEVVHDDSTTHVGSDVADRRDTFSLSNPSLPGGATISKVTVYEWVRREGIGYNDFYIMIRSGSTDSLSDEITGLTITWVLESWEWTTDPNTGVAWTVDGLNALEAGGKVSTGVDITQVYVVVSHSLELELGNNFEIEQKGHVDTSAGDDKNLVYREDAFRVYISDGEEISVVILSLYNPDAHVETSSVDGHAKGLNSAGDPWSDIQGRAGDSSEAGADDIIVGWDTDVDSNRYDWISRGIVLFDTTPLPDAGDIVYAFIALSGEDKGNDGGWTPTIGIYSSDPATNTAVVDTDYSTLGTTLFSDSITYADWSTTGYNVFALNEDGISAINRAGISKFGVRTNYDATNTDPGWTGADATLEMNFWSADKGAGYVPKLIVAFGVTATGVSSGEHIIKATADGTNLKIFVADPPDYNFVEKDSTVMSGASVPDNSNNWTIMQNNVMPYMEYYKHTVSGTLIAWYQPNAIITNTGEEGTVDSGTTITLVDSILTQDDDYWNLARLVVTETTDHNAPEGETAVITNFTATDDTLHFAALTTAVGAGDKYTVDFGTLPDREGAAQDGVITWGSNPSGISVSIGGLESTGVTGAVTPEEPAPPEYVSETPAEDLFTETTGENIPIFYPIFKIVSDNTGWPIQVFWITGALALAMLFGALAMIYLRSMLIAGIASMILLIVFCSMNIIPWWTLYIYIFMAVAFIVYQRVVSA